MRYLQAFGGVFLIAFPVFAQFTVTAPNNDTVANPQVHVAATCPTCTSLVVTGTQNNILASGTTSVDAMVSIVDHDGLSHVYFTATTPSGTFGTGRDVLLETSTNISKVDSVNGVVLDTDGTSRILYEAAPYAPPGVFLHPIGTSGQDQTLFSGNGFTVYLNNNAYLTPTGAMFLIAGTIGGNQNAVYEFRNGALESFSHTWNDGSGLYDSSLQVNGNYALWLRYSLGTQWPQLYMLNLSTDTLTTLAPAMVSTAWQATNGVLAYISNGNVYSWNAGTVTQLTTDGADSEVATDGTLFAYLRNVTVNGQAGVEIVANNGAAETILMQPQYATTIGTPGYKVVNGQVVFEGPDGLGSVRDYLQPPSTGGFPVTFLSGYSTILSLAPNGDVTSRNNGQVYLKRLSQSESLNVSVDMYDNSTEFINGQWYYLVGDTVFQILPGAPNVESGPGSVSISSVSPANNGSESGPFQVSAHIASFYALQSATVCSGSKCGPLYPITGNTNTFGTVFDPTGLSPGSNPLTITAADVFNHTSTATSNFSYGGAFTVTAPINGAVATPQVRVAATCAACTSLVVTGTHNNVLASGATSVDAMVTIADRDGQSQIYFTATTPGGNFATGRSIFVETSPALSSVGNVNGVVLDSDGTSRTLYIAADSAPPGVFLHTIGGRWLSDAVWRNICGGRERERN